MPTDEPIAPFHRTGAMPLEATIGDTYADQVFVDLASNAVTHRQPVTSWHLSIACDDDSHRVFVNDGLLMKAANMGTTQWTSVNAAPKDGYRYDHPSGSYDSLALQHFWPAASEPGNVFVIHRGFDHAGKNLGYCKIQGISSHPHAVFRVGSLDGTVDTVVSLRYDGTYRRIGFNLTTLASATSEPPSNTWDLVFTRYTFVFDENGEVIPYIVVGALLQHPPVRAVRLTSPFHSCIVSDSITTPFSAFRDAIGYEWKDFDLQSGTYTVDTTATYLVNDRFGFFRAIRFLDFYDASGKKGTIHMEQRLL